MDSRHSEMQDKNSDNPKLRLRADLISAMRSHHQRRRIRRHTLAMVILVVSAGTLAFLMYGRSNTVPSPPVASDFRVEDPRVVPAVSIPEKERPRHSIITIVRTDPNILQR